MIEAVFSTAPEIVRSPAPVILFSFFPPVKVKPPLFVIPFVIAIVVVSVPAVVVNEPFSSIIRLLCSIETELLTAPSIVKSPVPEIAPAIAPEPVKVTSPAFAIVPPRLVTSEVKVLSAVTETA